ncbi:MAG TPA: amino acid ABC transporter ATP-binding protein [Ramlibacter sp.]|uniref:amino acid ABC transporter ATP-binding protein n=1 Tax=Ramlibacter sp. TaxID=1917967 RepID=UPI002C0480F7|nr:amino acid ABC transporter ATP-binding protein [Ramlibacter sp.]HVZ44987.1 amino acid ABC transporter ATP-binding protein [Ramlibacter sp.]
MNTQAGDVVRLQNVSKWFGASQVLNSINLQIKSRERLVICGPSGSGKSTLVRCISGLEPYQSGSVHIQGEPVSGGHLPPAAHVGMVFQQFNLFPHLTVLENCTLAQRWVLKRGKAESKKTAMEFLARVRMDGKAASYPAQLSGGQQQRVAIARALCLRPDLMLFDEATSALDPEMVKEVLDVMIQLAEEGMTMVCVTHEMGFARQVASQVAFMDCGKLVEMHPPGTFFDNPGSERLRQFLGQVL